jgi:aryl-alcohol dehydrogenase-like predicted oxidoreductase
MSEFYGSTDEIGSVATSHRALDLGVNLLAIVDMYGAGRNEQLVRRAICGRRAEVALATIRLAYAVYPTSAQQTEHSLWSRDPERAAKAQSRHARSPSARSACASNCAFTSMKAPPACSRAA